MNALRPIGVSGHRSNWERPAVALAMLGLLLAAIQAGAQESQAAPQEPKSAVYKIQEAGFLYRSSVAIFSCDALRDRVRSVLLAIGARDDLEVRVNGCDAFAMPSEMPHDGWQTPSDRWSDDRLSSRNMDRMNRMDRAQSADVRVRAMMPTEITPQVLAEIDKDKSRRELISKVTGNPAAALNDPVMFSARREQVTLSRKTIGVIPEECELLDQMSSTLIPKLGAKVVRRSFTCDRHNVSHLPPTLIVEALMPVGYAASPALPTGTGTGTPSEQDTPPVPNETPPAGSSENGPPENKPNK